jgi:hypothetical protein
MKRHIPLIALVLGLAGFCLCALFVSSLFGLAAALVAAGMLGFALTWAAQLLDFPFRRLWPLPVLIGGSTAMGVGIACIALHTSRLTWVAVPVAALSSLAFVGGHLLSRRRCALCARRLGPHALCFRCPRCGLAVCEESCWNFEERRCRLCLRNHVPLLSRSAQWWDRAFGPRATNGRCQLCMDGGDQADLRCCGRCRRAQCWDCWDHTNGECMRCGWTAPGLPDSLNEVVSGAIESTPAGNYV